MLISRPPSMVTIGFTSIPGCAMSISRKEMPSCFFPSVLVRTRQNIFVAHCASVVQVLVPLTM